VLYLDARHDKINGGFTWFCETAVVFLQAFAEVKLRANQSTSSFQFFQKRILWHNNQP
jgi:hypothetical protein